MVLRTTSAGIIGLGLVGLLASGWVEAASEPPASTQISGSAVSAAVAMASRAYPQGVGTAILTSAQLQNLADAVSAAPLADTLKAPMLLTLSPTSVGNATVTELKTLHVDHVILIGADDNAKLKSELPPGVTVTGYAGANRYQTSAEVFRAVETNGGNRRLVFYASGNNPNLTDALTVDAVASAKEAPILLLPPTGGIPKAYAGLISASQTSYVVGAAVSYHDKFSHVVDLAGVDRFATATLVNQQFFPHPTGMVVTNASYLMDSLVASTFAGTRQWPMVMVGTTVIPGPSFDYLAGVASSVTDMFAVGSSSALSSAMVKALVQLTQMDG